MLPTLPKIPSLSQTCLAQAASSNPLHFADEAEPKTWLTSSIYDPSPALVPTGEVLPPAASEKHLPEEHRHVRAAPSPCGITD